MKPNKDNTHESDRSVTLSQDEPSGPVPMLIEIDRIKPYDRNPRRIRNPRYADIRDSIWAQGGLNNPLTITRRPGDEHYMVESGGNTRLQALYDLWRQTGDQRFYRINCLFRPWKSESHVISAHLIENELRGDMTFIDKALAIMALKAQFEQERNESISQRYFIQLLSNNGMVLSRPQFYRIVYAVEVLWPVIPLALSAGLGAREVDAIRQTIDCYRQVFLDAAASNPGEYDNPQAVFDAVVADVLAGSDNVEAWSFDAGPRDILEHRVCETLGIDMKLLRANVAVAGLQRKGILDMDSSEEQSPVSDQNRQTMLPEPIVPNITPVLTPALSSVNNQSDQKPLQQKPANHTDSESEPATIQHMRDEIYAIVVESMRSAFSFESDEHLRQVVIHTPSYGAGYLIEGVQLIDHQQPGVRLCDDNGFNTWWLLSSLSGVFDSDASFDEASTMTKTISQSLQSAVGNPEPLTRIAANFLCAPSVPEQQLQRLFRLIALIRRLREVGGAEWRHAV